jgi:hypothetical protein
MEVATFCVANILAEILAVRQKFGRAIESCWTA